MQALGVIAPDVVVESVTEEFAERGRVGVVHADTDPVVRSDGVAATTYDLGSEGWHGRGEVQSLDAILDRLARDHDYAVVTDAPESRLPHLVVGDRSVRRELHRVEDATAVDPAAVADALAATTPYETLGSLVAKAKRATGEEYAGAIATFTGRVRARDSHEDDPTEYLEFEQYGDVAEERLATIREDLTDREGVQEVLLHHRTGVVAAGEDIVFVVVLAGHRSEAFRTVEDGINRLKDEVPIFKKEVTVEEEFWVHDQA
ncbi:MAG: molybdopterin synthase [Halobacteriaceae archaeon]